MPISLRIKSSRTLSFLAVSIAVMAVGIISLLVALEWPGYQLIIAGLAVITLTVVITIVMMLVRRYEDALSRLREVDSQFDRITRDYSRLFRTASESSLDKFSGRLEELERTIASIEKSVSQRVETVASVDDESLRKMIDGYLEERLQAEKSVQMVNNTLDTRLVEAQTTTMRREADARLIDAAASFMNAFPVTTWPKFLARLGLAVVVGTSGTMTYVLVTETIIPLEKGLGFLPLILAGIVLAIMGLYSWAASEREKKEFYEERLERRVGYLFH